MLRCPVSCAESGCGQKNMPGSRYCEKHTTSNAVLDTRRAFDALRYKDNPWRAWYGRWPWRGPGGLHELALSRDPICKICNREPSTIADHIIPHRGDWALFTDLDGNIQGVCKACHDRKTATDDGCFGKATRNMTPLV